MANMGSARMKQIRLVIYRSVNGRDNWEPVAADSLPEFVRNPDVMGRLVAGGQCMDAGEKPRGSAWYRAVRVVTQQERAIVEGALSTLY